MKHHPYGNYFIVEKIEDPFQFDDKINLGKVMALPESEKNIPLGSIVMLDNVTPIPLREDGKEYYIYRLSNIIAYTFTNN